MQADRRAGRRAWRAAAVAVAMAAAASATATPRDVQARAGAQAHARTHALAAAHAPAPDPLAVAQPDAGTGEALLLVEIPAGGSTKFETRPGGLVEVDRFLQMPVAYPANYGALPSTLAGDGDPLDALVLTREALPPGVLVRFRPVAVLRMVDGGEADQKLVGVPADDVDPAYSGVRDLASLPAHERARIEAFFRVYKQSPAGDSGPVELHGWGDAAEARRILEDARAAHRAASTSTGG
jgi:inorganic pyrophosphatase